MIRPKAKELAKQTNVADLVGRSRWCSGFMRRNRLSVRSRITVGQKLPENWEEKVTNFRQFVARRKEELAIQADRVFNMKEQLTQLELKAFLYGPLVTRKETSLFSLRAQSPGKSWSQWSSLRELKNNARKKTSPIVWLFTTTKKDGWIEIKWLCGVRKFGFPTCVLLRQSLSAHFRQFQGTYWWRCSQHQNWTKNNYRSDSLRPITKKLQPLDICVNLWGGEGGLGAIFRFFSLLRKDALENLSLRFLRHNAKRDLSFRYFDTEGWLGDTY